MWDRIVWIFVAKNLEKVTDVKTKKDLNELNEKKDQKREEHWLKLNRKNELTLKVKKLRVRNCKSIQIKDIERFV